MKDDKECFNALIKLNNIARLAMVDGDTGDVRNSAVRYLDEVLKERIDIRNQLGEAWEKIEALKKENSERI